VVTIALIRVSALPEIRVSHGVLIYLLLIIGASRQGGRALSAVMVCLGYLAVDWFFVPPRFSFGNATQLDWIVLIGFALSGLLISALFDQLHRAVHVASERTAEIERLSTERLQLEREASKARVLRDADRLKNALLQSVTHDLRSPIATLSLLSDPAAGFRPDVALPRVHEKASRLAAFIGTLQRFATNEYQTLLAADPFDAADLIRTALRMAEARFVDRQIHVHPTDESARVCGDLTLSQHVFGNLLQHAVRHAPATAPIDTSTTASTDWIAFTVADRGPGIAEVDVERIFSPLRRARATHPDAESDTRTGMGLAIARTFARAQQGDVYYRARPGGGSEFVLRLPRASAPASERSPTATAAVPAPAS
jgi:two-component system sensor histidine kinase KdpD